LAPPRGLSATLVLNNTSATSRIVFGDSNNGEYVNLFNTTMQFGSVSQGLNQNGGCGFTWKNTPSARRVGLSDGLVSVCRKYLRPRSDHRRCRSQRAWKQYALSHARVRLLRMG
jgi:hypothetical protein